MQSSFEIDWRGDKGYTDSEAYIENFTIAGKLPERTPITRCAKQKFSYFYFHLNKKLNEKLFAIPISILRMKRLEKRVLLCYYFFVIHIKRFDRESRGRFAEQRETAVC